MDELLLESQELAGVGSWEWDAGTNRVIWSDELFRIFGLEPQTFPATFEGYLAQIHPDDRARVQSLIEATLETRSSFDHEERILRADGEVRILHSRGRVLADPSGLTLRMVGACQDVTELKETEQALREAHSQLADALHATKDRVVQLEEQVRTRTGFERLVGKSAPMQEVYRKLRLAAQSDVTVLLTGESGTGKELAASAVHSLSDRKAKPFVAVNCSAIPEALLESELFGHTKGAFTGAVRDKIGLFQAADGGTLFLDEVGDMSPALQVKVLRALQEREVRRVGDERSTKVDVRIIAATNRDLSQMVAAGKLREDFYYRIRVFEIVLPPLRDRREDIPLLVRHFLATFAAGGTGRARGIGGEALRRLMNYSWPGNVRELENAIEHCLVTAGGAAITPADLPDQVNPKCPPESLLKPEEYAERERVQAALEGAGWNQTKAAAVLGISRVTVWKKMRRFGLRPPGIPPVAGRASVNETI